MEIVLLPSIKREKINCFLISSYLFSEKRSCFLYTFEENGIKAKKYTTELLRDVYF